MRRKLVELAVENEDVALCDQAALEGATMLDRMQADDAPRQSRRNWLVDFGLAAKARSPCCRPADSELDLLTGLLHTIALLGNPRELCIPKPFLKPGPFHLQPIQTVSTLKLEQNLGVLTTEKADRESDAMAEKLQP